MKNPVSNFERTVRTRSKTIKACFWTVLFFTVACILPAHHCDAKPTQADFFKGMQEQTADTGDPSGKVLLSGIIGTAAVIMLLSLISLRRKRELKPKAVNHQGKLLKEITKRIPLRPVEIKQLRVLAESQSSKGTPVENPLVMLLCPSLLARSLKQPPAKIDRKVIAGLARKLGMTVAAKAKK